MTHPVSSPSPHRLLRKIKQNMLLFTVEVKEKEPSKSAQETAVCSLCPVLFLLLLPMSLALVRKNKHRLLLPYQIGKL